MLTINEIFYSIQGESTHAGKPCVFIRLTGCHLRCAYCDTAYAFHDGKRMSIQDIIKEIQIFRCKLVEVTGGEPLLQEDVYPLMDTLIESGNKVLLETSGSIALEKINPKVIKIIDFKTPSSQMTTHNRWSTLEQLSTHDEIKFVISDRSDYEWARRVITQHNLPDRCHQVLMSPTHDILDPGLLGQWITQDALCAKLQIQLHKYLKMR